MARVITGWFEFNGRRSTEFGVRLLDALSYVRPEWRGTSKTVSGRSGGIWLTEDPDTVVHNVVQIKRTCRCPLSRMEEVAVWLTGSGLLRFSWAENRAYEARAQKEASFSQVSIGADPLVEFNITFECQPYRLLYPAASAKTITASGTTITNPGTAPSLPRVKIAGSGNFSVTIGMETLWFLNVDGGGIIVDSEKVDAFTYDGTLLANDKFEGEPFMIQPGNNVVSWTVESGSRVDSVEILPRWRYL